MKKSLVLPVLALLLAVVAAGVPAAHACGGDHDGEKTEKHVEV